MRVRLDRQTGSTLLLYPERGLVLNRTAADVVGLCTGERTVGEIVDELAARYAGQPREAVEREVLGFLGQMADRGLVRDAGAAP